MSRIALVTGGMGGIGTAICQQLAKKGHKVYANYYSEAEKPQEWLAIQKELGFDFEAIQCDVSNYESAKTMVDTIIAKEGKVEILINCAGITRDKVFKKMTVDDWVGVINTNLIGVFNVTNVVINSMLEAGFGRIVNISSVNGRKGQFGQTNYSAAKAGVHGFTKALAQETATKGITVNSVSPGYTNTPMVQAMNDEVVNSIVGLVPMGRLAETDEIAHAVEFLCGENSGYITGSELAVNGGIHMY